MLSRQIWRGRMDGGCDGNVEGWDAGETVFV